MKGGQKKSHLSKDGFINNTYKKIKNYFAAAWIANLGVVPLFLLAAFLFAPAFFFFLNLLLFVTHVLETIRKLLCISNYHIRLIFNFKPSFLPTKTLCVKEIILSSCSMLIILLPAHAEMSSEDIILARGQSREIPLLGLKKFSISNKEVISYRYQEQRQKMLIRGRQLGHSELLTWLNDGKLKTYQIFILSKKQELKLIEIGQWAQKIGLYSEMNLTKVKIWGQITSADQYFEYKKLSELHSNFIIDSVELTKTLKNQIISEIYLSFFNDYKESISCKNQNITIICQFSANESPSESLKKHLSEKYKIEWIQQNYQKNKNNYLVKLKLLQIEQLSGEEFRLGLEELSGNLGDFLKLPLDAIIAKNQVLLKKRNLRLSSLAEPEHLIRPMIPAIIQVGSEIPFTTTSTQNQTITQWHFAGLKVQITLENLGSKVKVDYETELTQPNGEQSNSASISGNKEKSSVVIDLSTPIKIFQISLKTQGKNTEQLPLLGAIPLIGEIFKSKGQQSTYKTISGIIRVEEHE